MKWLNVARNRTSPAARRSDIIQAAIAPVSPIRFARANSERDYVMDKELTDRSEAILRRIVQLRDSL